MKHVVSEVRFSIVPEWILDADISDRAVRIYAILARYADSETLEAFPSRNTLAKRAHCHVKSVDRAIEELEQIDALRKTHRKIGDAYASNLYVLRRVMTPQSLGGDTGDARVGTPESLGRDTSVHLTITKELEPKKLELLNESFAQFWSIYPLKKDKAPARRAFEKALKRTDLETILDAAQSYANDPNREPGFTKYPATWLNADAWDNGPEVPRRKLTNYERNMMLLAKVQSEQEAVEVFEPLKELGSSWLKGVDDVD